MISSWRHHENKRLDVELRYLDTASSTSSNGRVPNSSASLIPYSPAEIRREVLLHASTIFVYSSPMRKNGSSLLRRFAAQRPGNLANAARTSGARSGLG